MQYPSRSSGTRSPRTRRARSFRIVAAAVPLVFVAALLAAGVVRAAQGGEHRVQPRTESPGPEGASR